MARVRSVLVVDRSPASSAYRDLEQAGWICGHAPDLTSAVAVLRQIRPALVLVVSADGARDELAVRTLRQDPLMAGVPLVVTQAAGRELPDIEADAVVADADLAAQLAGLLAERDARPLSIPD